MSQTSLAHSLPHGPFARVVALALVAILASGVFATSSAGSRRLALGVSMLKDRDIATYDAFVAESGGRAPATWSIWSDWGSPHNRYLPLEFMAHLKANRTVPLIIWQPVDSSAKWNRAYSYKRIADGTFDSYLRTFARQVQSYDGRVLIRFAHEFDGSWYPWGVGKPGNSIDDFKRAWKHVYRIFRDPRKGVAKQARFVWSPTGSRGASWMQQTFPGKSYVDYIGFTAFNWASYKRLPWQSLSSIVERRLRLFAGLPRKPIIVAETGSDYRKHSKANWLKDGYATVYRKWPRIVAISYFSVDMRETGDPKHHENWSLDRPTDGTPMQAYRWLLRQSRFQGRIR